MKTKILLLFLTLLISSNTYPKKFQIYSIVQNITMGDENEVIKKNYYLNIGRNQGVAPATILNVYRSISRLDPYETKGRFNYRVQIGKLKVIHVEDSVSIASLLQLNNHTTDPMFEISSMMIGDSIKVDIKK